MKKYTLEQVRDLLKKRNTNLLSKEYKNIGQNLEYRCLKCGYKGKKSLGHLDHSCNWYRMDLTEEYRINRRSVPEYRQWAKKIKKNDNYTCQKCKDRGGRLQSHHKNGWSNFTKQRYLESNGVTLCKSCHIEFHSIYGKGNNIESQTELFLNERNGYV